MKSKNTLKGTAMIRAVIATAFALVLCLPVGAAFAIEGEDAESDGQPTLATEVEADPVDTTTGENAGSATTVISTAGQPAGEADSGNQAPQPAEDEGEKTLVAANTSQDGNWKLNDDGTVEYIGAGESVIVVPSEIDGRPVIVNRDTFRKNEALKGALTQITFAEGVKLGKSASNMFEYFTALKTVFANGLDTSECTNMNVMFHDCKNLTTLDASEWNVGSVTNMADLLNGCEALTALDVSKWDVSSVTSMANTFHNCKMITELDVSKWDTSNVTDMNNMFNNCRALTTLDVSKWNVGNVTNMRNTFTNCRSLTALDVSNWDVRNVENMFCMFSGCESLTSLNVSNWNTSHVTNMGESFRNCENLATLDVSGWNVGNVENMAYAFQFCKALSALDVSNWDVRKVTTFRSAFEGMPATTVLDLTKWEALSVQEFAVHEDGKWETSGWQRAFRGPLLLVNDGQMKQRLASPNSDGKYIGFDVHGSYGVFLEDSMERVWCLNYGVPTPAGNAFAKYSKHLDEEGLAFLETLVADTEMDKAERWKKIAAAITFFGNVINSQVQDDLQDTIWYYSDNLVDAESRKKATPNESTQKMIDYVEAHWQELDYSKAVINFYDSETEPTKPTKVDPKTGNWNLDGKFQNMISLTTAASIIRKDLGSIVISKEIATKSDANTDTTFTFTVRLTGADGKPLATSVSAASEGEDLHSVTPKDGVIILTTTGEGEACIHNLPVGTAYTITEASLEGWLLVGTSNAKGTVAEGVTLTATFTNDRAEAKTSATIKKIWDDEGDLDKLRPASITVTLSNGTTVTLSEDNDWTATITDLPKYDAEGKPIAYTWTEGDMPEGYVLADVSVDGTVTTLTNAHKREEQAETKGAGAGGMAQTGDSLPAWPFAMLAAASLAMMIVARKKQRSC